jgi:hypothetical protein
VSLEDDLRRIADAAVRYTADGEELAGIVPAEPSPGRRAYLCAFRRGEANAWVVLDDKGRAVDGRADVRAVLSIAALCELAGAEHRRLDRVQERGADARDLELADRGGGRASGRCHHLPQLDRVHAQVAHLLRRPQHGLHDELRRDLAGEPEQQPRLDHRLRQKREVRRARA